MVVGIFAIIGVLLGFYLAKYQEINKQVAEKLKEIKKPKGYGEPFVVSTDEAALDEEKRKAEEQKEKINLKDFNK